MIRRAARADAPVVEDILLDAVCFPNLIEIYLLWAEEFFLPIEPEGPAACIPYIGSKHRRDRHEASRRHKAAYL